MAAMADRLVAPGDDAGRRRLCAQLEAQLELVVIDFLRYCLEDGVLLDEDIALVRHADACLARREAAGDGGETKK